MRRGDLLEIRVTANAFLRRMVRSIVALLMEVGRGGWRRRRSTVLDAGPVRSTGVPHRRAG